MDKSLSMKLANRQAAREYETIRDVLRWGPHNAKFLSNAKRSQVLRDHAEMRRTIVLRNK